MALFRLQINSIVRSERSTAPGAAAYRAGERIRDERTGRLHNHSRRQDVVHKEIFLPAHLEGQDMGWAQSRASLWNAAEYAEKRGNARVAREIQVTLPAELPAQGRLKLARDFSREVADHYNVAVDLSVHQPRPSGDPRNFHAHLLITTREVRLDGLGAKTGLDMDGRERHRLGLPSASDEYRAVRARWAELTNEALREANVEARVDHRPLAEQGIDRVPRPHIPFAAYQIERSGRYSEVASTLRADYVARVEANRERAAQHPDQRRVPGAEASIPAAGDPGIAIEASGPAPGASIAEIGRHAVETWLRMRAAQTGKTVAELQGRESTGPAAGSERPGLHREDDLAL